ncbi:MAG: hypothetical protein FD135_3605 [Comamonadaceae bacterium]|nr:MAG: hypothetical protein FD135_3605 [Comamonadaceae bacterium]
MADKIDFTRAYSVPRSPSNARLSWIKRRARCIAMAFQVNRREAVASAAGDWHMFNPTATQH